jgi:hypothetical protein
MTPLKAAETDDPVTVVTALVGYLDKHSPEMAVDLRKRFPGAARVLAPGKQLGPDDDEAGPKQTAALLQLSREALSTAKAQIEINTATLHGRLRFAARIRLVGALVATLSGAGLIGALIAEARILAFSGAAISFVSSVATLIAQYVEAPIYGDNSGPQALFASLVPLKQQMFELLQEVELAARGVAGEASALALVRQANKLVAELDGIEMKMGR